MKFSPRTAKLLFPPTVALCMSVMMSFVLTIINQGIGANFISKWLTGFAVSFVVAVPISWFVVPRIQKFYDRNTEKSAAKVEEKL
ncbi:MAG: DUF2798 domain-containing protein [Acidobacteriota bacterium]|nr:DUF2798 domain-containing protein [Acidobacteriota bacterium]